MVLSADFLNHLSWKLNFLESSQMLEEFKKPINYYFFPLSHMKGLLRLWKGAENHRGSRTSLFFLSCTKLRTEKINRFWWRQKTWLGWPCKCRVYFGFFRQNATLNVKTCDLFFSTWETKLKKNKQFAILLACW